MPYRIGIPGGMRPEEVASVTHGSTVATNAALEGSGARVGLLCTEGSSTSCTWPAARPRGPLAGWVTMIKPEPLASVEDTRGIVERGALRGEMRSRRPAEPELFDFGAAREGPVAGTRAAPA